MTEMATLGAPVIRAVWDEGNGVWHAVEGTHRLAAAARRGLVPSIVEVSWDEAAELLNSESGSCWTGDELDEACHRVERGGGHWLKFADPLEVA